MADKFSFKLWFMYHPFWCFFRPHSYKFEPMPGDLPPYEFDYCARCGRDKHGE